MYLSLALIIFPILGAALLARTKAQRNQSVIAIVFSAASLLFSVINLFLVQNGGVLTWGIESWGIFDSVLRIDSLSGLFSLFSSFVWLAAGIYMHTYMESEERAQSLYLYYLITLGATQGIFLAGNFIILLVFFEIMALASGAWVTFYETDEAEEAGALYHNLGVAAGVLIGVAIILLFFAKVGLRVGVAALAPTNIVLFGLATLFLIIGFGIKAGMFPVHIWLPKAHPVAPTPSSALLSGVLLKTGAYGLVRTGQLVNWGHGNLIPWVGTLVVVLGIITMILGVCLALLQGNAKRLLAYHSISQMGYIIVGIGAALFLNQNGAFGLAGAVFHSLNHALFKSALFFGVGIIVMGTGEADLYKLGGLWKRFPFTGLMMLIAAFGITGTPGLNGYISKTLLHHGILDAAATGNTIMIWAERLFVLVGVGTTASFAKLIGLTFFGKQKTEVKANMGNTRFLDLAMLMLAVVMLVIGTQPGLLLGQLIGPATASGGIVNLRILDHIDFWEWPAIRDMIITLTAGFAFFAVGMKTGLFHLELPAWLSIEAAFRGVQEGILSLVHPPEEGNKETSQRRRP